MSFVPRQRGAVSNYQKQTAPRKVAVKGGCSSCRERAKRLAEAARLRNQNKR